MGIKAVKTPGTHGAAGTAKQRTGEARQRRRAIGTAATIAAVAGSALLLAACGSSASSSSSAGTGAAAATTPSAPASAAASGTVTLKTEKTSLGTVLADGQGFTVYWFAADHGDMSACTGACAAAWPPVTGVPAAMAGVTLGGTLGTITRAGGVKQATYNGHPLYTYAADTSPGQVNGNDVDGFGAYWYAITIGASTAAKTAPSTSSGGGW